MENRNQVLLFDRLEKNYTDYVDEWSALTPFELIEKAEEICATQLVKEHLLYTVNEDRAEWLLRFQNPLEVMRDKWMEENGIGTVHDEDISHALWTVMDCQDTESLYALTPDAAAGADRDKPVTVREFIERHPSSAFNMMTPGGYVSMTPEKAKALINGESIQGHPGSAEYGVEILADELLDQEVVEANFKDNVWYLLTDYRHEMQQEPPPLDMGVMRC